MQKGRYIQVKVKQKRNRRKQNPLYRWLCWVTNNETHPKHEVQFDIAFFIINTIVLIGGVYWFSTVSHESKPFVTLLVIEYTWALDTLRNNRSYIK